MISPKSRRLSEVAGSAATSSIFDSEASGGVWLSMTTWRGRTRRQARRVVSGGSDRRVSSSSRRMRRLIEQLCLRATRRRYRIGCGFARRLARRDRLAGTTFTSPTCFPIVDVGTSATVGGPGAADGSSARQQRPSSEASTAAALDRTVPYVGSGVGNDRRLKRLGGSDPVLRSRSLGTPAPT